AIASRKEDAFPLQFDCKLVDQGCGGSALADVGDIESSQLCCLSGRFADGRDAEGFRGSAVRRRREIRRYARNDGRRRFRRIQQNGEAIGGGGHGVLAGENQPVELCEVTESTIEWSVVQ